MDNTMQTATVIGKADIQPNTISFHHIARGSEMLRISPEGFYVRGEKLEQDEGEARKVFNAFTEWLRTTGAKV